MAQVSLSGRRNSGWQHRIPARALAFVRQGILGGPAELALLQAQCDMRVTKDSKAAVTMLDIWSPHLLVVDADLDWRGLLRPASQARLDRSRIPLIVLQAHKDSQATVVAFADGADDVVALPCSPDELFARIAALLRRCYEPAAAFLPQIKRGDLQINIISGTVRLGERQVHVTGTELNLLYLLAANVGRLSTRDDILNELRGVDYNADSNVIDQHVRNLRRRLRDDWRRPRFIATVPGKGYRFIPQENLDRKP